MSNIELREYLQKSRQGRRELIEIAEEIVNPVLKSNTLLIPPENTSDFPYPNSQRFIKFKDSVNTSLQGIFRPEKNKLPKKPVLKSLTKEEHYKRIYIPDIKSYKASRKTNSCTPGQSNCVSLFSKYSYKGAYLSPLFPKPSSKLTGYIAG